MWWRKRLVRLHMDSERPSIEGIHVGFWANHYVLKNAVLWEAADRSSAVGDVRVPRQNVIFVQEMSK